MASNLSLAGIPTVARLFQSKQLVATSSQFAPSKVLNDTISIIRNDITKLQIDCIVNAANRTLLGGGGVDGAIHRAAGPDLLRECEELDGCDTGDAKITLGHNLPCEKVIHTVGPVYDLERKENSDAPEQLLRSCYWRSLEVAVENNMKSIAFPAISTGVYGYPSREAAEAAIDETRKFLTETNNAANLERVIFCNFEAKDVEVYHELIPQYFPPTAEDLGEPAIVEI